METIYYQLFNNYSTHDVHNESGNTVAATKNLQYSENDCLILTLKLALNFEMSRRLLAPEVQKIFKSLTFRALRIFLDYVRTTNCRSS